jgi:hypothetical protein
MSRMKDVQLVESGSAVMITFYRRETQDLFMRKWSDRWSRDLERDGENRYRERTRSRERRLEDELRRRDKEVMRLGTCLREQERREQRGQREKASPRINMPRKARSLPPSPEYKGNASFLKEYMTRKTRLTQGTQRRQEEKKPKECPSPDESSSAAESACLPTL